MMFAKLAHTPSLIASPRVVRYANFAASFGLCAVMALAPLPFGSMDPRLIATWVIVLVIVLLIASSAAIRSRDLAVLYGFAAVAAGLTLVISLQLERSSLLSGWLTAPIWNETAAILGEKINGSVSVARNQPFFSAGSQIACVLSMLCGFLIGRDRRSAYLIMTTFLGSALIYAIYGLFAFGFWPDYLLWHHKFNYLNSLTATFVNPNVAASYFGAATLGWLLVFIANEAQSSGVQLVASRSLKSRLLAMSGRQALWLLACFVMLVTLMMTGSRAGSVISLLAIAGALTTWFRRSLRSRGWLWAAPGAAVLAVVAMISIMAPVTSQRFAVQGFFDQGRSHAYSSTIAMIWEHPWLGSGLGTFRWNFPAYRSPEIPSYGIWEQSHNTLLEIAAEMGLPFASLLVAGWLGMLIVLGNGMFRRNRDAILSISAFWIALLATLHSQLDFPLQIPGFSLAICPILGMGMAQSYSSKA